MEKTRIQDEVFDPEDSVFRSMAWASSWLEIYGSDQRIDIIDLGGRKNPLEMLYGSKLRLKSVWPVRQLALVGCGSAHVATPRSEYNHLQELACVVGGYECLRDAVDELEWDSLSFGDMTETAGLNQFIETPTKARNHSFLRVMPEHSYLIRETSLTEYHSYLEKSGCDRYFGKRDELAKRHGLEWERFSLRQFESFVGILNKFHVLRWGSPCYSDRTQRFLREFLGQLADAGGNVHLRAMRVGGEILSVQLDVEWRRRRYNLQSGFDSGWRGPIKLGSIHLGKAIEDAIDAGKPYDLLVGRGRATNYKASIATHRARLPSIEISRGLLAHARAFQQRIATGKTPNREIDH